tara:strand:+ start:947 stop:1219 length:273 start_codon:yes stop_codon:yes gene_type:complete
MPRVPRSTKVRIAGLEQTAQTLEYKVKSQSLSITVGHHAMVCGTIKMREMLLRIAASAAKGHPMETLKLVTQASDVLSELKLELDNILQT